MNKIIWTIIFLVIITGVNASLENLGEYKQGTCINIIQTCSNCTYNNITSVLFPDGTNTIYEESMTKSGIFYYKQFCKTKQVGSYYVTGHGDLNGQNEDWIYLLKISMRGETGNESFDNTAFYIGIAMIIVGFIYLKISRIFGSIMLLILGMGVLFVASYDGWIGWIIIACGITATLYSVLISGRKK